MAARTPANVKRFPERFPSWPGDSLAQRIDIEAGSWWTIRDIGTFQILRQRETKDFPEWLDDHYLEAKERVSGSKEIQGAVQLLDTDWRQLSRAALLEASGSFAPFLAS
jgi:hypothetical protein